MQLKLLRPKKNLRYISENMGEPSEMALLGRLHWWTVEYGLIGTLENPKIYGAGLLSSIGESATCMHKDVEKLWYNIDTVNYQYDITKPQPQLFVTETFQNLIDVLEQFANTMAFRRGGSESIMKAIACKNVATAEYSSGLQVSGIFTDMGINPDDEVTFIKTTGPSALAFNGKQLDGHGKDYHADGFSSPVGKLKNTNQLLEDFSAVDLESAGIIIGNQTELLFDSGIKVVGRVKAVLKENNKVILIAFSDCTVTESNGNVLFRPEWGTYDMAVGAKITSVFNGAADKDAYEAITLISEEKTHQITYDAKTLKLHELYKTVRTIRENGENSDQLAHIFNELKLNHRQDWLCALEVLEIVYHKKIYHQLEKEIQVYLEIKAGKEPDHTKLINDGLHVIKNPVSQLIIED